MSTSGSGKSNVMKANAGLQSTGIEVSITDLADIISLMIKDVSKIHFVSAEDLNVLSMKPSSDAPSVLKAPDNILHALESGTKFFDAVYYFSLPADARPKVQAYNAGNAISSDGVMRVKNLLLWQAIFVMIRGEYGQSTGSTVGADVPAFLTKICGMNTSPAGLSAGLASFDMKKIPKDWIKLLNWKSMNPAIAQRLGLGLAGYRLLGPFKVFPCKEDATEVAKKAYNWAKTLAMEPHDWAIHSATRDPGLIAQLGSFNKALNNLILECFTEEQITVMLSPQVKILSVKPEKDPRANTWVAWADAAPLVLKDPIFKN